MHQTDVVGGLADLVDLIVEVEVIEWHDIALAVIVDGFAQNHGDQQYRQQ